jgi:hypothetical protein
MAKTKHLFPTIFAAFSALFFSESHCQSFLPLFNTSNSDFSALGIACFAPFSEGSFVGISAHGGFLAQKTAALDGFSRALWRGRFSADNGDGFVEFGHFFCDIRIQRVAAVILVPFF